MGTAFQGKLIAWIWYGFVMIIKRILSIIALLSFATLASQSWADMTIYGYAPENHYRFYEEESPEKAFIGESYNWSGVGRSSDGRWATMISPQYFLTAEHYCPADGATVTFYADNTLAGSQPSYTVDSWSQNWGDLCLRRLTQPIGDDIAFYPILDLPSESNYADQTFFAYGKMHRVGRNQIDKIQDATCNSVTTRSMVYDYNTSSGLGADECLLESGDSGGPSLIGSGGELALVGIHWLKYGNPAPGSADSFVPHYLDEIRPYVNGGDANMDGIVNDTDATILAANWDQDGAIWAQGDFNNDGLVNADDIDILAANWLRSTTWLRSVDLSTPGVLPSAVPEPTAAVLLLMGALFVAILHYRRHK